MRKFVVFVAMAVILAMSVAFSAKAQYVYPKTEQAEQVVQNGQRTVQFLNLTNLQEYKDAKRMRDKGMGETFGGAIIECIGWLTFCVPTDDEGGIITRNTLACVGVGVGTLFMITGTYKWIKGETRLNDLRLAYAMSGNGIVVTF